MTTGDGYGHSYERSSDFRTTVAPIIKTAGIPAWLAKGIDC